MKNKINISELLKDCPQGMELDCTMYDNLYFDSLNADYYGTINCYTLIDGIKTSINFTKYGTYNNHIGSKCVIFPKGKTTWEGFVTPGMTPCKFKAGDVLVSENGNIVLLSHVDSKSFVHYHCIIPTYGSFRIEENTNIGVGRYYECTLANEKQKQRMYDKIKCSGYKYNQSTNKLEKLPELKFKDGDILYAFDEGNEYIFIFKQMDENERVYCYLNLKGNNLRIQEVWLTDYNPTHRLATEEEQQKLFDAIKANGYNWDEETKTLKWLYKPKFHEGNWVVNRFGDIWHIDSFDSKNYQVSNGDNYNYFPIEKQNEMHLWTIQDAKDGDVLADKDNNIGIFQKCESIFWHSYIYLGCDGKIRGFSIGGSHEQTDTHPATKEEKQKLFDAIKDNGYKWNSETKTLKKLVEPIFEVGNKIEKYGYRYTITEVKDDYYITKCGNKIHFDIQDDFSLVPNKFDITTLKPFESRVLVRDTNHYEWEGAVYGRYDGNSFFTIGGVDWRYCIPYEGNEHLLGTTNDCDDYFKIWQK